MKWRKSPQELIETFAAVTPPAPVVPRQMFGYPAAFLNGNMFMSLFQESFVLRLPDAERGDLDGWMPFEPMPGRAMRDYLVLPEEIVADRAQLTEWVGRALEYAHSLPAKSKTGTKTKTKTKTKTAAKTTSARPKSPKAKPRRSS